MTTIEEILLTIYIIGFFIAFFYIADKIKTITNNNVTPLDVILTILMSFGSWLSVIFTLFLFRKK
jgi:hypothetical protein